MSPVLGVRPFRASRMVLLVALLCAPLALNCGGDGAPQGSPNAAAGTDAGHADVAVAPPPPDAGVPDADASTVPDSGPDAGEPPCLEGDLNVVADVPELATITCVRGALSVSVSSTIAMPALREVGGDVVLNAMTLRLPRLRTVGGKLEIRRVDALEAGALESVKSLVAYDAIMPSLSLPALARVSGDLRLQLTGVVSISLPLLETVDGALRLEALSFLTALDLSRLRQVGGDVSIDGLTRVASLGFPSLERLGAFVMIGSGPASLSLPAWTTAAGDVRLSSDTLASVSAPRLARVGSLTVNAPVLSALGLPALAQVDRSLSLFGTPAWALASLSLPSLETVGEDALASDLPGLAAVDFTRLRSVGKTLGFVRMPLLASASFPALVQAGGLGADTMAALQSFTAPVLTNLTNLTLADAPLLATLDFGALTSVRMVQIIGTPGLTSLAAFAPLQGATYLILRDSQGMPSGLRTVSLPAVRQIGRVDISVRGLETIDFPALESISQVELYDVARLQSLGRIATVATQLDILSVNGAQALSDMTFPRLTSVTTLAVQSSSATTGMSFPVLRSVATLRLDGLSALATLELPALSEVTTKGDVRSAPRLSQCILDAVNARLTTGHIDASDTLPCR